MDEILSNLKTNMSLKARVLNFNEQKKKELLSNLHPDLESLSFIEDKDQKNILISMVTKGKKDLRAKIAKSLIQSDVDLLELTTEKSDLEDLFKRIEL
jgi:hypothetical protein